jgi:hypothetical protein
MRWIYTAAAVGGLALLGLGCSKDVASKPANAPAAADEKPLAPPKLPDPGGPGRKQRGMPKGG